MDARKRILVEGWRFSPNSLAVLSQCYCLQMLKRPDVELYHKDVPFWTPSWTHVPGLLPPDDESALRALREPPQGASLDASLRIAHPTLVQKTSAKRTWCWIITEYSTLEAVRIADGRPTRDALRTPGVNIITCSQWSKQGLVNAGADPDNIALVHLGFDPRWYKPVDESTRDALRKQFGWEGRFVFLNISTLWWNKGIGVLLQAFNAVAQKHPDAILVLKGNNRALEKESFLSSTLAAMAPDARERITSRIRYMGEYYNVQQIASMYQAADAYVAPYHGEGFNLPALEAAACGLPVICTAGGSTDEFTTPDFCRRIQAQAMGSPQLEQQIGPGAKLLQVDGDHLIQLMGDIVGDGGAFRRQALATGPAYVRERFTWEKVTADLVRTIAPG